MQSIIFLKPKTLLNTFMMPLSNHHQYDSYDDVMMMMMNDDDMLHSVETLD